MKAFNAILLAGCAIISVQAGESMIDFGEVSKKSAEVLSDLVKKFEEATGLKTDFDKEKFLKASKEANEKLNELQKKLKEAYDQNSKNIPNAEEIKKKLDDASKQIQETLNHLNSPDVQKSADKLKEIVTTSLKKSNEAFTELLQKFGLAPPPNVQKSLNEAFDEIVKTSKVVQEKLTKIVEDAQAELKKKKP